MKSLYAALLITLSIPLFAQESNTTGIEIMDAAPGYYHAFVITSKLDTLIGDVVIKETQSSTELQASVNFVDKNKEQFIYKPGDLTGFGLYYEKDTIYFESVVTDMDIEIEFGEALFNKYRVWTSRCFAQKIAAGYLSLYYLRNISFRTNHAVDHLYPNAPTAGTGQGGNGGNGVIKINSATAPGAVSNYFLMKGGNGKMVVLLREKLADYFADCQTVVQKINLRKYKYNDLPKIITEYNRWKESMNATPQRY